MSKNKASAAARIIIILCAVVLTVAAYFLWSGQNAALISACNAVFVVGLAYLIIGLVVAAFSQEGIGGLLGATRKSAGVITRQTDFDPTDYERDIRPEKRPSAAGTFFAAGVALLVIAAVLFFINSRL